MSVYQINCYTIIFVVATAVLAQAVFALKHKRLDVDRLIHDAFRGATLFPFILLLIGPFDDETMKNAISSNPVTLFLGGLGGIIYIIRDFWRDVERSGQVV